MATTAYTIPSATTPGTSYRVTIFGDGATACDCPDATYRRRQCKHQRQALVLWTDAGRAGQLYAPAAAPQPAHEMAIVEGFDGCGRPLYTPLCHTCHRAGQGYLSRETAARLTAQHATAVRS